MKIEIGQKFSRLTVSKQTKSIGRKKRFDCACECGKIVTVDMYSLLNGSTQSCGCLGIERRGKANSLRSTHGESHKNKSPEYRTWLHIKYRCYNRKSNRFKIYGGRGIKVCKKWINSYESFLKDVGRRPSNNHSIERINVNGNYEPSNVKWATKKEQARNTRNTRWMSVGGIDKTFMEWCEIYKINPGTVNERIKRGWTLDENLFKPSDVKYRNKRCKDVFQHLEVPTIPAVYTQKD